MSKIQDVMYRILHHKPVLLEMQINRAENFLSPLNRRAVRCRRKKKMQINSREGERKKHKNKRRKVSNSVSGES